MTLHFQKDRNGFTLVELIVVIAILGVLAAYLVPQYIQYVDKARLASVEQEAGEFNRAAEIALVDAMANEGTDGAELLFDNITIQSMSSLAVETTFVSGSKCGRLTNWWLQNNNNKLNIDANPKKHDHDFAAMLLSTLRLSDKDTASLKVHSVVPSTSDMSKPADDSCIFQIFFNANGKIATEYYRKGYFVRIENGTVSGEKVTGTRITQFSKADA